MSPKEASQEEEGFRDPDIVPLEPSEWYHNKTSIWVRENHPSSRLIVSEKLPRRQSHTQFVVVQGEALQQGELPHQWRWQALDLVVGQIDGPEIARQLLQLSGELQKGVHGVERPCPTSFAAPAVPLPPRLTSVSPRSLS